MARILKSTRTSIAMEVHAAMMTACFSPEGWSSRGFQAGWLLNMNGTRGLRWLLVSCGIGCAISSGCKNCPGNLLGELLKTVQCFWAELRRPLDLRVGQTIFVAPEGDLFHKDVPDAFIYSVFSIIEMCPHHRFIMLTKRAERMGNMISDPLFRVHVYEAGRALLGAEYTKRNSVNLTNVLIGVSIEEQKYIDRADILTEVPYGMIPILFAAPMLGPLDLNKGGQAAKWVVINGERSCKKPRRCKLEWQGDLLRQARETGAYHYLLRRYDPAWIKKLEPVLQGDDHRELHPSLMGF